MKAEKIDAIQALRGIAALCVVARHSYSSFKLGAAGVDLFFIISGFTMVYASQRMFGSVRSIVPFLARRCIRIYPAYWAATALIVLLLGSPDYMVLLKSALLIPSNVNPIILPAWTLIYEMGFYAIFSASLFLPMKQAVAAIVTALVLLVAVGPRVPFLDAYASPLVLEFGIGVIIGLAYCEGARLSGMSARWVLAAGLLSLGLSCLLGDLAGDSWLRQAAWGVPSAMIFVALVFGPEVSFLKHKLFQDLGEASYSIYVIHWVAVCAFIRSPHHHPAIFIASILLGIGLYYAFERPVLKFLRAKLAAWESRGTSAEPIPIGMGT